MFSKSVNDSKKPRLFQEHIELDNLAIIGTSQRNSFFNQNGTHLDPREVRSVINQVIQDIQYESPYRNIDTLTDNQVKFLTNPNKKYDLNALLFFQVETRLRAQLKVEMNELYKKQYENLPQLKGAIIDLLKSTREKWDNALTYEKNGALLHQREITTHFNNCLNKVIEDMQMDHPTKEFT